MDFKDMGWSFMDGVSGINEEEVGSTMIEVIVHTWVE